jgi:hypothetical protein
VNVHGHPKWPRSTSIRRGAVVGDPLIAYSQYATNADHGATFILWPNSIMVESDFEHDGSALALLIYDGQDTNNNNAGAERTTSWKSPSYSNSGSCRNKTNQNATFLLTTTAITPCRCQSRQRDCIFCWTLTPYNQLLLDGHNIMDWAGQPPL